MMEMSPVDLSLAIAALLITAGAICSFIRLILGPTLSNRVVALDYITFLVVASMCLLAIRHDDPSYLDVAIVIALLGFLAVIAFARYVEYRMATDTEAEE